MKILFAYSKTHFDPSKPKSAHKYWDSSANILARNLYEVLTGLGDVVYIDSWNEAELSSVSGKKFDILIGIIDSFARLAESVQANKKILWAVNSHPTFRNHRLKQFVRSENLGSGALNDWDIVGPGYEAGVKVADLILGVGDNVTYNSFVEQGVPKQKIKMINYGVGPNPTISKAKPSRLAYIASDIGLRKGFDIVSAVFSSPEILKKDFHLDIVGPISTKYYEKKMHTLKGKLGDKLTYHGWLDADSKIYNQVLSEAAFLVFPALEEGQAGTVLDSIKRGVVPISSANTGVPFSPLGRLELSTKSQINVELIIRAMGSKPSQLDSLRDHTKRYYEEFHANWQLNLEEALRGAILNDQLYPKISLVLPIFNKEATIEELLANLDRSCQTYNNNELHIIFDGCRDKTKRIVKRFFRGHKKYLVTFESTPNIFEVKTNNIGLKKSTGKYATIVQDDNFIYDRNLFFETAMLLDNNPKIAILGGLAGVNFYPRGYKNLKGSGQIAVNENESYWRQDANTNPDFRNRYYEVDACMRGPLTFRKSFLEQQGYLDEAYAPFYMDDMDIGFRARKFGFHVYTALFNVENKSHTIATYDTEERKKFWEDTMKHAADIFYGRWQPSTAKDYDWIYRTPLANTATDQQAESEFAAAIEAQAHNRQSSARRRAQLKVPLHQTKRIAYGVTRRVKRKIVG